MNDQFLTELQNVMGGSGIFMEEPMKKHTTFKIGGPADIFVKVKTIQELKYVIDVAKKENAPVTVIGNGSNILVKDGGIRGIVVKPEFKEIEFIDEETKTKLQICFRICSTLEK